MSTTGEDSRAPTGAIYATAESFDDGDFDLEAGEEIPTIDLNSELEIEAKDEEKHGDDDDDDEGSASALEENAKGSGSSAAVDGRTRRYLVASVVATPVGGILSSRSAEVNNEPPTYRRAEFISAAVNKPSPGVELGLSFKMRESGHGIVISEIRPDSVVAESKAPLQVGDRVISVNNFSCDRMDYKHAAKLLREAEGCVKIVVQNSGGDPQMVESMIAKPDPNHPTGIGFASTESPPQLNVSRIFADGLFAHQALLTIGDEVLSINCIPCRELDSAAAADIIKATPQYVTVVARKFEGQGVVIASSDDESNQMADEKVGNYGTKKQIFCFFIFFTALFSLIMYLQYY